MMVTFLKENSQNIANYAVVIAMIISVITYYHTVERNNKLENKKATYQVFQTIYNKELNSSLHYINRTYNQFDDEIKDSVSPKSFIEMVEGSEQKVFWKHFNNIVSSYKTILPYIVIYQADTCSLKEYIFPDLERFIKRTKEHESYLDPYFSHVCKTLQPLLEIKKAFIYSKCMN